MTAADAFLLRSPLHAAHVAAGGRLVEFAGWEMPVLYTSVIEEHRAVRQAAGLFDVSHMGEIRVAGPGAEELLQRLTPNNVAKLEPGRAHYSALLTERGTFLDDLLVYKLDEGEFLLVVNAANAERDFEWVSEHAAGGARVENRSDAFALLAVQGPRAADIVQRLTSISLEEIRYYRFQLGRVAGADAIVSRTGYTGEDGFELYLAPDRAVEVWDELLGAGRDDGLRPAGLGARDTLRLEAGMALYGHEIDETTTPLEAGLSWVVKMGKGEFVGREALARQQEEGIRRTLTGIEMVDRGIARQGHRLLSGGDEVGVVTSGSWSPTFEKALAMAYLPVELAQPGTEVQVAIRDKRPVARVVETPFYKRDA
ncbi:MAG: glycine cleavage system aminomethyltransferase GcvT [Thermoanaerobaculia bacterium]|nr:glycine cleavage system aminomethyltransferase GcvT [Thermoanaerobaculia bacterium]